MGDLLLEPSILNAREHGRLVKAPSGGLAYGRCPAADLPRGSRLLGWGRMLLVRNSL